MPDKIGTTYVLLYIRLSFFQKEIRRRFRMKNILWGDISRELALEESGPVSESVGLSFFAGRKFYLEVFRTSANN